MLLDAASGNGTKKRAAPEQPVILLEFRTISRKMEFSKTQNIFINALLGLIVVVLGSYLVTIKQFTATFITCGFIILGMVGFNILRSQRAKKGGVVLFSENFENFDGWIPHREGGVFHSDEYAHNGKFSLKKSGFNDPNGGFKRTKKIKRGFIFSGWIYRPSQGDGGPADRLAIEDSNGNGYGFGIRHENESFLLSIEKRMEGAFDKNLITVEVESTFKSLTDIWYQFNFHVSKEDRLVLNIDCENKRLGHIQAEDCTLSKFHQIAVHGGHPYYVDEIKIRLI